MSFVLLHPPPQNFHNLSSPKPPSRPRPVAVRRPQETTAVIRRRFPSPTTIFNISETHTPSNQQLGPPNKHPKTYIRPTLATLPTQPNTLAPFLKKKTKPTFSTFFALIPLHKPPYFGNEVATPSFPPRPHLQELPESMGLISAAPCMCAPSHVSRGPHTPQGPHVPLPLICAHEGHAHEVHDAARTTLAHLCTLPVLRPRTGR